MHVFIFRSLQVGFKIKDQKKILDVEQDKLRKRQECLAREKNVIDDIQQQRKTVQSEIREEMHLAKQESAKIQNFFAQAEGAVERAECQVTNQVQLLQKKLDEKNKLMQAIAPVLKQMKGKFYFNLSKRKQRSQLRKLHTTLAKDVTLLQKAIDFLLQ